jgi:hypothetical protein
MRRFTVICLMLLTACTQSERILACGEACSKRGSGMATYSDADGCRCAGSEQDAGTR